GLGGRFWPGQGRRPAGPDSDGRHSGDAPLYAAGGLRGPVGRLLAGADALRATGPRPAFGEKDRGRLISQLTTEEPPRLGKVNPRVPRDLQTIVRKVIEREPSQRYASAGDLAADLSRFVEDQPIQARQLTLAERLRRWVRRHKVVAALLATLATVLAVGFAG